LGACFETAAFGRLLGMTLLGGSTDGVMLRRAAQQPVSKHAHRFQLPDFV